MTCGSRVEMDGLFSPAVEVRLTLGLRARLTNAMSENHISRASFNNFTAFKELSISFSPGVNVLIGRNATGKTHVLKALYCVCSVLGTAKKMGYKIVGVFLPSQRHVQRLVRSAQLESGFEIRFVSGDTTLVELHNEGDLHVSSLTARSGRRTCAFIPAKEMLANAPGFVSLMEERAVHFEEVYADIIHRAFLPPLRQVDQPFEQIRQDLAEAMGGQVVSKGEEFFLESKSGSIEFTLLAEGLRKLGLLWLLIGNGVVRKDSILFWDEPEANLNPSLVKTVVKALLELRRNGVQVFVATHSYVVLKEFDLLAQEGDEIRYHSLHRDTETDEIECSSTDRYVALKHNAIVDTYVDLYERDVERDFM